jgi:plastocyanin
MRKVLVLLVTLAAVCAIGVATAKTLTVTITNNGYVPNASSINQGDSVQLTNADTVAHQVSFKKTAGVTCAPNPLVLQAGQSGSCTFQTPGSYNYSDPNSKGNTFSGTVTVAAAATQLSLAASPLVVTYGAKSTLSGTLSSQKAGETLDVFAQACGAAAATKASTVVTTTGGAYSTAVQPLKNTIYTLKLRNTTSSPITDKVRPRLRLARVAAHRYSLRVTAAATFAAKYASFQRLNSLTHRWVAVKTVRLVANNSGVAPTVISTASFRSTIKTGLPVRVVLGQAQVGTCYLAGTSNTIRS